MNPALTIYNTYPYNIYNKVLVTGNLNTLGSLQQTENFKAAKNATVPLSIRYLQNKKLAYNTKFPDWKNGRVYQQSTTIQYTVHIHYAG